MSKPLSLKERWKASPEKPPMKRPRLEDVPLSLASAPTWCGWQFEKNDKGEWAKVPFNAKGSMEGAFREKGWNQAANLVSLPKLLAFIQASPMGTEWGVGLACPLAQAEGGGPCSLDFDNVLHENGTFANTELERLVRETSSSILWECSASGSGLHAIGMGLSPIPEKGERKPTLPTGGEAEVLVNGRFCAVTGDWMSPNPPKEVGPLNRLLELWPKKPAAPEPQLTMGSQEEGLRGYLKYRASLYVAAMEPSRDGQNGHGQLMRVAAVLKGGFGYGDGSRALAWESDGQAIFEDFNRRGDPESSSQLAHKWASATTSGRDLFREVQEEFERKQKPGAGAPGGGTPPRQKQAKEKEGWTVLDEETLKPASAIGELEKVEFLWEEFIPKGFFGVLSGWPGEGKSTALGGLVAAFTQRGSFIGPMGSLPGMDPSREPVGALWISCEETEQRIKARIQESGADLSRVHIVRYIREVNKDGKKSRRTFQLPTDTERLRSWLSKLKPGIVILDSMSGLFSADHDATKAQKSRGILNELCNMAEDFGSTIILISHNTKHSAGRDANKNGPLYLAAEGSIAFAAAARFQLLVAQHPEDKELPKHERRKVLFVAKTNEFKQFMACPFRITSIDLPKGASVRIPKWEAASMMDEEEFRGGASADASKPGPVPEKTNKAMQALEHFFAERIRVPDVDFKKKRKAMEPELGCSESTIKEAIGRLRLCGTITHESFTGDWLYTRK